MVSSSSIGFHKKSESINKAAPHQMWQLFLDQLEKYGIAETAAFKETYFWKKPSLSAIVASAASDDFGRLARRILGRGIGFVLSGGGAKGLAHIGVIQALVEAGIPVDSIGGTSIGSFMGALYARHVDYYSVQAFAHSFSQRMSSKWRQILDLTYPITSWFTGHAFNRTLWKIFGDRHIEDLWLPFYCVTTDIAHSKMMVHREGYIWRYVRASMSLSGFLPPLCDNGALLVDGGYMDNVPVDAMLKSREGKNYGMSKVIAIDVGSETETDLTDYGDTLSGFWLLLQKMIGRNLKIPNLTEIQYRLAFVSCIAKLEQVKEASSLHEPSIIYLRPPVAHYGVMDFGRYQEIFDNGYKYGQEIITKWRQDGTLRKLLGFRERKESDPLLMQNLHQFALTDNVDQISLGSEFNLSSHSGRMHVRRRSM